MGKSFLAVSVFVQKDFVHSLAEHFHTEIVRIASFSWEFNLRVCALWHQLCLGATFHRSIYQNNCRASEHVK